MWGGGSVLPLKPSFQGSSFQKYPFMVKSMNGSVALGRTQKNERKLKEVLEQFLCGSC